MGSIRKKGEYTATKNQADFTNTKPVKNKNKGGTKPVKKEYDNVAWNKHYGFYVAGGNAYWKCHEGNTKILTINRDLGGTLFMGGWSRGAHHTDHMAVIDLTGGRRPRSHRGTYYKIGVEDFGVPHWSTFFWESLAMMVYNELLNGDVLIACQGGHGRSGMIVSILSYILSSKRSVNIIQERMLNANPVDWVRDIHCHKAVETGGQEIAVLETCLEFRENVHVRNHLEEARKRPRYLYRSKKYDKFKHDWADEKEPEEQEPWECPICLSEHNTVVQAVMCCGTGSLYNCPVCVEKTDNALEAYNHCRQASLS